MLALAPIPRPIPDVIRIPLVFVKFVRGRSVKKIATENSAVLFGAFHRAAVAGFAVGVLREEGKILDTDSLLALNAYLRTVKLVRGGKLPFTRLGIRGHTSRYGWRMFKSYLDLQFV